MPLPNKINKDNFKKRSVKQRLAILLSKRGNR